MKFLCDTLLDLVPFVQLKKRENTHGEVLQLVKLKPATLLKKHSSISVFHVFFKTVQMVPNGAKHHI